MRLPPENTAPSAISDESRWFAEEVQLHEAALRSYLQYRVPCSADVDDVVQDSYLKILQAKPSKEITSVRAYLFTIARNTALKLFRKRKIYSPVPVGELPPSRFLDEGQDVAGLANIHLQDAVVAETIAELPDRRREILLLRVADGLTPVEIAGRLGVSESTVRTQLTRAMDKCTQRLRERGVTPGP